MLSSRFSLATRLLKTPALENGEFLIQIFAIELLLTSLCPAIGANASRIGTTGHGARNFGFSAKNGWYFDATQASSGGDAAAIRTKNSSARQLWHDATQTPKAGNGAEVQTKKSVGEGFGKSTTNGEGKH
ncbi:hypothetical protein FRC03_008178 [Tulasnella sp. 419]|nr:hypothetical protein FRC03_008178 [Tulasnella sp. 419]